MFVKPGPFPNETPCPCGAEFPGDELSGEIECRQLTLVLDVKMGRLVIVEKHSDDDPEKRRDDRHLLSSKLKAQAGRCFRSADWRGFAAFDLGVPLRGEVVPGFVAFQGFERQ